MSKNGQAFVDLVLAEPNPYDVNWNMEAFGLTKEDQHYVINAFDGYRLRNAIVYRRGQAAAIKLWDEHCVRLHEVSRKPKEMP